MAGIGILESSAAVSTAWLIDWSSRITELALNSAPLQAVAPSTVLKVLDERVVELEPRRQKREIAALRWVVDVDGQKRRGVDFGRFFRCADIARHSIDIERPPATRR